MRFDGKKLPFFLVSARPLCGEMKEIVAIIILLTVTPICGFLGVGIFNPNFWDGTSLVDVFMVWKYRVNLSELAMVVFFGLTVTQLWFTYIPVLIVTPLLMRNISKKETFYSFPLLKFIGIAIITGIIVGSFAMFPCLISSGKDIELFIIILAAGAFSGVITSLLIAFLYRSASLYKN